MKKDPQVLVEVNQWANSIARTDFGNLKYYKGINMTPVRETVSDDGTILYVS